MTTGNGSVLEQLRRNAVALIGLAVALRPGLYTDGS
jgi:hypothetical protein